MAISKIFFVGVRLVGSATGEGLAEAGYRVTFVDTSLAELLAPSGDRVQTLCDCPGAELVRCMHNIFNATEISFWNEMWLVRGLGCPDPRSGPAVAVPTRVADDRRTRHACREPDFAQGFRIRQHADHSQLLSRADAGTLEALSPLTVGILGLGYVGLPTALGLAKAGVRVLGCDVSETRLTAIKTGLVDLLATDHDRLTSLLGTDKLVLTTEPRALAAADVVMVCVPTPVDEHLVPDLTALQDACQSAVDHAVVGQTIVLTSTTYVGCTRDLVAGPLRKRGFTIGEDIFVAFSPERIDPGNAAHVPACTPRVVGGITTECTRRATQVFGRVAPVLHAVSSPEAAEMTKLLENTFRAVNIALANEFSSLARELDIDPIEVIEAAATKPYGFMPFYPGPGAGGHCIPCDPHYLLWQLKARRIAAPVITAAMDAIAARPRVVVARAQQVLAEHGRPLTGSRVLVLGVTYKPGVADVRQSPALEILNELAAAGANVAYSDPMIADLPTATGTLVSEHDPGAGRWDLVIVHTLQPGMDHSWLTTAPIVLDATYQLHGNGSRYVV